MPWLCEKFGWHRWGKWSEPKEDVGRFVRTMFGYPVETFERVIYIQDRTCLRCGEHEQMMKDATGKRWR